MKWTLLMQMVDDVIRETGSRYKKEEGDNPNIGPMGYTIRPNNGEWDVVGREESSCEFPAAVGLHCGRQLSAYQFYYEGLAEKKSDTLVYDEKCEDALQQVAKGEGKKVKKELLKHLEQEGYLVKRGDKYEPTFLVMYQDARPITEEQQESLKSFYETFMKVTDAMGRHYEFCREQVLAEVPEFLKENSHLINHVIASFLYKVRGAVLEEAIRQGYLTYEEEKDNRMLGVYLYV